MDSEAHLEGVIDEISAERDQLEAEVQRLRALVETAYSEGFEDGDCSNISQWSAWERSNARAALQPKEGEG